MKNLDSKNQEHIRRMCRESGADFTWEDSFSENCVETETVYVHTELTEVAQDIAVRLVARGIPFTYSVED